jgi:hypothetical protein
MVSRLDPDEEAALSVATLEDIMALADILNTNPQEYIWNKNLCFVFARQLNLVPKSTNLMKCLQNIQFFRVFCKIFMSYSKRVNFLLGNGIYLFFDSTNLD